MSSISLNNHFGIEINNNNKGNNVIAIIEEVFLNIGYGSSYKKLIKKVIYKTFKFFMHFTRYMSFRDRVTFCEIKLSLKSFQTLKIFLILSINVDRYSKSILANEIGYKKIKYLIF